tara:strand:- start:24 stop:524 length:501 start_codon:yes stop_codon:yes gene_type:complete
MRYSPDWIFSLACSVITKRYVEGHLPIEAFTKNFAVGFDAYYDDLTSSKLNDGAEEIMRFLASFYGDNDNDQIDYMLIVKAHIFREINFDKNNKKRKFKGFFYNSMKPKSTETSVAENTKSFKAFFFQQRSKPDVEPDPSWDISKVKDIDDLLLILNGTVAVFDAF